MKVQEILRKLDLGNSVAEFDDALEHYFIETETFRSLTDDRVDIVAGDKGTGKTALYKILASRYRSIPSLRDVEVITGFNPSGSPIFQRLTEGTALSEGQYITIWKAYILSLLGNWVLEIYKGDFTENMWKLDDLLKKVSLRTKDDSPTNIFSRLISLIGRIMNPQSAEVAISLTQEGIPIILPKIHFGAETGDSSQGDNLVETGIVRHQEALGLLNTVLAEAGFSTWLILDRLDEAFQGFPQTEIPALRALLRTYLDIQEFDRIKLKLFVRKDLFRKVTQGGFVNLTHINARKIEIIWDDEDLFDLLFRRIKTNQQFVSDIHAETKSKADVFDTLFPDQVDVGTRRPKTWSWIILRIRDGNNVKPPRNLIDLVKKAQEDQLRREERDTARNFNVEDPIISSDAMKWALKALSRERVEDTLLAEAGDYAQYIERFRDGKSEHNEFSLSSTLEVPVEEARRIAKVLMEIGFLEQIGDTYKIPALYRDGLKITQGKAF